MSSDYKNCCICVHEKLRSKLLKPIRVHIYVFTGQVHMENFVIHTADCEAVVAGLRLLHNHFPHGLHRACEKGPQLCRISCL
jgi:hypothetical protein